jgi:hypothetical protein
MENTKTEWTAEALAAALEKAGITNDTPEIPPNPYDAAREAFFVWQRSRQIAGWCDLKELFQGPSIPRATFHRKLADICHRALRRPHIPEDIRESVAYAWGYFDALVKAKANQQGPASIA